MIRREGGWLALVGLLSSGLLGVAGSASALEAPPTLLAIIGSYGTGPGQLGLPHGLGVDGVGNLFVADAGNHRISQFTWEGAFVRQWGSLGTGPGQFHTPWNVLSSRSGHVYVTEREGSRVQKFTGQGAFVLQVGTRGTGTGQVEAPWGIAEDAEGTIYVSDWYGRVQKFTPDGEYLSTISGSGMLHPFGITVRDGNVLYVLDGDAHQVLYFTTSGQFLGRWTGIGTPRCCPYGIAVDPAGNVLVADTWIPDVKKYSPGGELLAQWGVEMRSPHGIAVDPNNNIYIADALNRYVRKYGDAATENARVSWGRVKQIYR